MDVSAIVTKLQSRSPTLFAQILTASPGGMVAPVATAASLYTLLASSVSNRMYPVQLPESPTHPSIVYSLVSSQPGVFEGFTVSHTDTFVLNLRGTDYDALITLVGTITTALASANVDITDRMDEFDAEEGLYRIHLELNYTYIAASSQSLPAAYVYPIARVGDPNRLDNQTSQRVRAEYGILIVTASNNIVALQAELQAALVGWQQSAAHHEMEYSSGASVEGVGSLKMWREVYRDAYYMNQS